MREPSVDSPGPAARRRAGSSRGVRFEFGGTAWLALPQRAVLWLAARWLVVADVHIGKAAAFRARGVPVPRGTTLANLERLSALIELAQPERLVFLGDLLHAQEARRDDTMGLLAQWRERHARLSMTLVEGNHDRRAGALPPAVRVEAADEPFTAQGIAFCHHPRRLDGVPVIAGHLHPCVRVAGAANDVLRLPCFWLRDGMLMLPAFGEFTGGAPIEREPGDRVLAVAEERLFEIPGVARAA
jgi:DNA ligase-associated metallophosphoesterase